MQATPKTILLIAVLNIVALLVFVFVTPLAFSAYQETDSTAHFWLWVTESVGIFGTGIFALLLTWALTRKVKQPVKRAGVSVLMLAGLMCFLGGIAKFNEAVLKNTLEVPRPFVLKLEKEAELDVQAFYAWPEKEMRGQVLDEVRETHEKSLGTIDPLIWKHWKVETGYSFPSGHTQNAFLMAFLFGAFLVWKGARWLWAIPVFLWAVLGGMSRVVLGVHSAWDVGCSALMALLIGGVLFYYFRLPFRWIEKYR